MNSGKTILGLCGWVLLCFAAASPGALWPPAEWYAALQKPSWNPPGWIFGPVWSALYTLMAVAAWLGWRRGGFAALGRPLGAFLVQLALNALWPPLFFGLQWPGVAFAEILLLWLTIAWTIALFWRVHRAAAWLLMPYLVWVSFCGGAERHAVEAERVLVECGQALVTMATYIDLNPVRAGLVEDPKEYRWCGYAAAVAGKRRARGGLKTANMTWAHGDIGEGASMEKYMEKYRELLFGTGEQRNPGANGQRAKRGISRKRLEEVMAKKGKLTRWEMLRCRVRYFCDGAVLGSKEFVNGIFEHERHRFGPKRQSGARPLRHVEADGLTTLRDLRVNPLG